MNKFNILKIVMFVLIAGCAEESTYTVSKLKNNTNKNMDILFFQNGSISKHFSINPNSEITVLDLNNRGKGVGLSFPNVEISFLDSAKVTFDSTKKSVHFSRLHKFDSSRVIFFESNRNIFNEGNYTRVITSETKHRISNEYFFEFTEQDFLNAK